MKIMYVYMAIFFVLYSALPLSAMHNQGDNNASKNLPGVQLESNYASFMQVCIQRGIIDEFKSADLGERSYSTIAHLIDIADARSKALAWACKLDFGTKTWNDFKTIVTELEKRKQEIIKQEQKKRTILRGISIRRSSEYVKNQEDINKEVSNSRVAALHIIEQAKSFSDIYYETLVQVVKQTEEYVKLQDVLFAREFSCNLHSKFPDLQTIFGKQYIQDESEKIQEIKKMLDNELSRFPQMRPLHRQRIS